MAVQNAGGFAGVPAGHSGGGGRAPFLYHRYFFQDCKREPIFIRNIDLMVRPKVPVIGHKTIDSMLLEAGLETVFKCTGNPPLIHYEGLIDGVDVEIEFLTDLTGSWQPSFN